MPSRSARCARGSARPGVALLLVLGLVAASPHSQDPGPAPASDELSLLRGALASEAPELRAEAAVALAAKQLPEDYPRLLDVSQDRHPDVRAAGILALGIHGTPGAGSVLADLLLDRPRESPERVVAAYALGLLPEQTLPTRLVDYLARLNGSNLRREEDVLRALFAAGMLRPRPALRTAMRNLLFDEANKAIELKVQLLQTLAQIPVGLEPDEVDALLESDHAELREAALRYAACGIDAGRIRIERERRDRIQAAAERDPAPAVRAAALRLLAARRLPAALELGARALRSTHAVELQAGVDAMVQLGGGSLRAALERRLREEKRPAVRGVLLASLPSTHDVELLDDCLELALDARAEFGLRCEAAAFVARSGDLRAGAVLRSLFTAATRAGDITKIADGLRHVRLGDDLLARCRPSAGADELRRLPARVQGLARAGYDTEPLVRTVCADRGLPAEIKAQVLRAARIGSGRLLGPEVDTQLEHAALPGAIAALLQ